MTWLSGNDTNTPQGVLPAPVILFFIQFAVGFVVQSSSLEDINKRNPTNQYLTKPSKPTRPNMGADACE